MAHRIFNKLHSALIVLFAPVCIAACPVCRAEVGKGINNDDFYTTLLSVLLPVLVLAAFGFVLHLADSIRRKSTGKIR